MTHCGTRAVNPAAGKKIVLAGNPNVGKSALFNALTGLYVDVANYPGTTLDMTCGRYNDDVVIEAPGVYGLSAINKEEIITRDIILDADIVVNVINSIHPEQDLFLTLQLIDMGLPLVVALNMTDEAAQGGYTINAPLLEKLLGVPVVPIAAVHGTGVETLKQKIYAARPGYPDPTLAEQLKRVTGVPGIREALLIIEGDAEISRRYGAPPGSGREAVYRRRRERANLIAGQVVSRTEREIPFAARLSNWMLLPATGLPLLALTLWAVYELIGLFLAQTVIGFTEGWMNGYYEPAVRSLLDGVIPPASLPGTVLAGQYGLLTLTVTYLIGLLLPLVLGIFLVLSILEDSGYMPRIATLLDRAFNSIGLNGQAVIPLLLGFGCVTMALITTRILGTERERRIAVFLLALAIPCSAQMAIVTAVLASVGAFYMLLYLLFMLGIIICAGSVLGRFLPGGPSPLLLELPPLRLPGVHNVCQKAWRKSYQFIKEAFPIFIAGTLLLSLLDYFGMLSALRNILAPVTVSWLHLPEEMADIFVMGFIRKEFGAAAILSLEMLPLQKFVVLLTLSLTVPCIASTLVIFKERGWREGLLAWSGISLLAFVIGGLATRVLEYWLV